MKAINLANSTQTNRAARNRFPRSLWTSQSSGLVWAAAESACPRGASENGSVKMAAVGTSCLRLWVGYLIRSTERLGGGKKPAHNHSRR